MPRSQKLSISGKSQRRRLEEEAVQSLRAQSTGDGSVIQRPEARTFNPENGGSNPSRPTINRLVVKKCNRCGNAMYVHRKGDEVIFAGTEPCIINLRLERVNDDEIVIKGTRSTTSVRCDKCKRRHLLASFEDVKENASEPANG